jgi:import inner membrane translocase subunit TIM50
MVYYKQFDNPIEQFKENQRRLLEQMEAERIEAQNKQPAIVKKWTPSFLHK